jgi:hypothetical protein
MIKRDTQDKNARRKCAGRSGPLEDWPRLRRVLRFLVATAWRSAWLHPFARGTMCGQAWRGRWLGPEADVDCGALASLIDSLRIRVAAEVASALGAPPWRSPSLYVFCGGARLMAKWFDLLGLRTGGTTLPHGMHCPGLGILVGGSPTHPEFAQVLAHEMCHAYVWLTVQGDSPSWADEGYAELVSSHCLPDPSQPFVEEVMSEKYRTGRPYDPIELPRLFEWEARLNSQAGLFASFLQARGAQKPEVWAVLLAALRGQIQDAAATVKAFEAAFGLPLCKIQQEFAKYCEELVTGIQLAERRRTPPRIWPN